MDKIEVAVLDQHHNPEGMMMFLARLTQRGHAIKSMTDLQDMFAECINKYDWKSSARVARLPHGTIKRFTPITIAIVGASRRFLAQARTHSTGLNFVSASLQYSDYSDDAQFCVPPEVIKSTKEGLKVGYRADIDGAPLHLTPTDIYIDNCNESMRNYKEFVELGFSNDTAGYMAPQGLRNILIIQGNHEAWDNFVRTRMCKRNTEETQVVTAMILNELIKSNAGDAFFTLSGPDCLGCGCREGKMSCGKPLNREQYFYKSLDNTAIKFLKENFGYIKDWGNM